MAVKTIEVHENVLAGNSMAAEQLRQRLTENGTYMINVMSSPGSGKTTLLSALINQLKDEIHIADMDVDIESDIDASRVADATGVASLQIHNGGLCHIDAQMTTSAIDQFDLTGIELLFLENIGNLVCPAEFDTGAHKNMVILSLPEGDDKPLKYPLMFTVADLVVISKIDTKDYFDFDENAARENIKRLNPRAQILKVSAKTGEGMEELANWVRDLIKERR